VLYTWVCRMLSDRDVSKSRFFGLTPLLSGAPQCTKHYTSLPLLHLCAPSGARAAQKGGTDETARDTERVAQKAKASKGSARYDAIQIQKSTFTRFNASQSVSKVRFLVFTVSCCTVNK
jgi:hypothetical protein